ncbi:MAG: hypothetical protein AB7O52_05075 [Planctomycetota bacterium]
MLSRVGSLYCLLCGLLLGPAAATFAVAVALGWLPDRPLERVVSALTLQPEAPPSTGAADVQQPGSEPAAAAMAPDLRLWSRRLEDVGAGIEEDLAKVEAKFVQLAAEEQRLDQVSMILTQVLTQLLGEEITKDALLSSAEELVARLEKSHSEGERRPWLLETLESMGARDVAGVLSGASVAGEEGMNEAEAVALLGGLPPRKAGQVLAEMGKVDPVRAARMLAQVGRDENPARGSRSGGNSP